ncbi:ATP-binding protein [Massilia sp. H-1]|nr:ATP-binding protein [Massilia sp. H-1]
MPPRDKKIEQNFGSLFEDDYLVRNLGRIAQDPEVALTELVANAWDAGASLVELTIPPTRLLNLVIADDGHGMSSDQFKGRWMKLSYDRIKHQSQNVEFPPERAEWRRRAYGRNGVGRHGMLCFSDLYEVETWREGKGAKFVVSTHSQETPFKIDSETAFARDGHGTRLTVRVDRHLPDPDRVRDILSARFLHDPQFVVRVNGASIALPEHSGLVEKVSLPVGPDMTIDAFVVDSTHAARSPPYIRASRFGSTDASWAPLVGSSAMPRCSMAGADSPSAIRSLSAAGRNGSRRSSRIGPGSNQARWSPP